MRPCFAVSPAPSMMVFEALPVETSCTPALKVIGKLSPNATLYVPGATLTMSPGLPALAWLMA
jgi:hypothetical protein